MCSTVELHPTLVKINTSTDYKLLLPKYANEKMQPRPIINLFDKFFFRFSITFYSTKCVKIKSYFYKTVRDEIKEGKPAITG